MTTIARDCFHKRTGPVQQVAFQGCVATQPDAHWDRAHGGVTRIQACLECGAVRKINVHGDCREFGPWLLGAG